MKRKLVSLALVLVLALAMAPAASAAALSYPVTGGSLYFDATTGAITDCDETVTAAEIPTEIYGVAVTSIGNSAFSGCSSLASVTIPSTVTSIGNRAFYRCTSLTSVVVPDSVTALGGGAFGNCVSLSHITLSRSLTELPASCFYYCGSLSSISLPDSITKINQEAFWYSGLTSITLPDSVQELGDAVFAACRSLTDVDLGSVTSAGRRLFESCSQLSQVTLSPNMETLPNMMFYLCPALEELVVPEGVTTLGQQLFQQSEGLRTLTLPSTLQWVGSAAFSDCTNLTDVYYAGTALDWASVQVGGANNPLLTANVHFVQPPISFSDVPADAWYASYVNAAAEAGLMNGTGNGQFSPAKTLSLAEVVTLAARLHAENNGAAVPASAAGEAWYQGAYDYCLDNGLFTAGEVPASALMDNATRFQMVDLLDRAVPESDKAPIHTDVTVPDLAEDAPYADVVYRWYRAGITQGDQNGNFNGASLITRGETATLFCRLAGLTERV